MNTALFCSLLFTGLAMAAGFAHAFELPNKITLKAEDYLTVQQIYRGWWLLGIVVLGSLVSTLTLTVMARGNTRLFRLAISAFLCIVGTQSSLGVYLSSKPADAKLDDTARQLGSASESLGVLPRCRRCAGLDCLHHIGSRNAGQSEMTVPIAPIQPADTAAWQ